MGFTIGPIQTTCRRRPRGDRNESASICSPTRKSGSAESVPGRGFAGAVRSLCLYRGLSRPESATLTKVWEEAEVEACGNEERGLTRCRGGSQGTWEMHSSRCQSPHQRRNARGPSRSHWYPHFRSRRTQEPSPARWAPPSEISRYRFIGRFNGLSPPSRATDMIEWWKNSTGKAARSPTNGRTKKTGERSATKRTPTYRVESNCCHRAISLE